MEIQNLSPTVTPVQVIKKPIINYPILAIILSLGLMTGFWISRLKPQKNSKFTLIPDKTISSEKIEKTEDIKAGNTYGNQDKAFKDSAIH